MSTETKNAGRKKYKNIKNIINLKTTIVVFFSVSIALIGCLESLIALFGDELPFFGWLKNMHPGYKISFIILVSVVVTLVKIIVSFCNATDALLKENEGLNQRCIDFENVIDEKDAFIKNHSDSICFLLEEATNRRRYQEVISIGSHLSLPLWYTGKYSLRIRIGHMVEFAAAQVGDKKRQALVLIEDIGWTYIRIKEYAKGTENIKRGLVIAREIGDNYLISQAMRNMADIHLINMEKTTILSEKIKESTLCKQCLDEALDLMQNMGDVKEQKELCGNIHYTYCKYYFELGECQQALISLDTSMRIYAENGFVEKQIKLYVLKGQILLSESNENTSAAIGAFQEGLRLAQAYNVNVHIVSNAIELCKIYIQRENFNLANQMLSLAEEVINAISDPIIIEKYNNCRDLLRRS